MAEVVLHLVRDDTVFDIDENELEDIDEALSGIDENAVDMDEIEAVDAEPLKRVVGCRVSYRCDDEAFDERRR